MAVQNVNQNLFQLLNATDKNIQDFLGTLSPGDSLKGRVVDIIPGENKAIINFRGFNIISELPQGAQLNKGDIINVAVSQINDRIFMKLIPAAAMDIGKGIDAAPAQQVTPQQIIDVLGSAKVPVNEQNIFIAQKLMDYHLPVTAQNIADINAALNNYMEAKGIDIRAFNIESSQAAKEIFVSNVLKFNSEVAKMVQNEGLPSQDETAAAQSQYLASEQMQSQAQNQAQTILQANTAGRTAMQPMAAGSGAKLNNMVNTLTAIAAAVPDITITQAKDAVVMTIKNAPSETVKSAVSLGVKEGFISQQDSGAVLTAISNGQPAVINSGNIQITKMANNDIEIKLGSIKDNLEIISTPGLSGQAAAAQVSNNMKDSLLNKLLGTPAAGSKAAANVTGNPDLINVVTRDAKQIVQVMRDAFIGLKQSVTNPGDTNFQQNVKDIANALTKLNVGASMLNEKSIDKTLITPQQLNSVKSDFIKMTQAMDRVIQKANIPGNPDDTVVVPKDFYKFQSAVKDFILSAQDLPVLKKTDAAKPAENTITIAANSQFDVESTIESLAFLKSRNIPIQNEKFIDTMGKYFKDDMKLNQNIESLTNAIAKFDSLKQGLKALPKDDAPFITALYNKTAAIKNLIQQVALDPSDSNLKQQIIEQQFKDFIVNSGLNVESRLKETVLKAEAQDSAIAGTKAAAVVDTASMKDNLKSAVISLSNELDKADNYTLTPAHKDAVKALKDSASDMLTNMNAIQFINQKPAAYEMIYTQLPIFLNNKFFNGEVQVWYRKGSLKENLDKAMPVNIVFMLNTSNLGNVKISMTIYKNDVECVVNASSEKAKQALMRGKADFLGNVEGVKYNMKAFQVLVDDEKASSAPSSGDGYVNLGRINLQA